MSITYKTTRENINWQDVSDVLKRAGLADRPANEQEIIFNNSYAVVFVCDGDKVVGVARAISDGLSQAAIYNVALDPEYQGNGAGRRMLELLLDQLKGQNVILYTHPQTVELYEHFGFRRAATAMEYFQMEEEHLKWMDEVGFFLPVGYRHPGENLEQYRKVK